MSIVGGCFRFHAGPQPQRRRVVRYGLALVALVASAACASENPPVSGSTSTSGTRNDAGASPSTSAPPTGGSDGSAPTDGGDAGDGGTCLGDAPDGGAAVCPSAGPCGEPCARILVHYKGAVARAAVECIGTLPSCENAADVIPCVDQALARACPDSTAPSFCGPLVTTCDPEAGDAGTMISQQGCELFANGLSSAGRAVLQACFEEKIAAGTCPTEVGACADEIRR